MREWKIEQNRKFHKRLTKMMDTVCLRLDEEDKFTEKIPESLEGAEILKEYL